MDVSTLTHTKQNYTYMTLLSSEHYLEGVLVLAQSLRDVGAKYNLVVCVSENICSNTRQKIKEYGLRVLPLKSKYLLPTDVYQGISIKRWRHTFDKIQVFNLIEFDKIVFLDADMHIYANIDKLFDYPHLSSATGAEGVRYTEHWNLPSATFF
jgi:alpha-N-acetylglucosamine transferase